MTGWIHRDLGEWDQLRSLFHPDATIDITWFTGKAGDFQAIYDICTFTFPTGSLNSTNMPFRNIRASMHPCLHSGEKRFPRESGLPNPRQRSGKDDQGQGADEAE